jgi:antitoxin FitA
VAALNIRNLDETVKRRLQVRAARHGRSMEAEVRAILAEAVREPADSARQSSAVHGLSGVGGTSSATATSALVSWART